jgi:hypothetical protein
MRFVILVVAAALACGGSHPPGQPAGPPAAARDYPATRWIPAKPTYALAARTVRDAQRGVRDVIDAIGMIGDVDASWLSHKLRGLLAIDPLSSDAVTAMGVDLDGGIAVFSEGVSPTFVIHLSAPEQAQAFFDEQRTQGLKTQSIIIDGAEIFTSKLVDKVNVSWVVVKDWLWVHFQFPFGTDEGTSWFTASHTPGNPTWTGNWQWAADSATKPTLVGFFDLRALMMKLSAKVPAAIACARLVEPVGRVAVSIEGDGHHAGGQLAFEIGPAARSIEQAIMPPPEGWDAVAEHAPLAAQWNLDLDVVRNWLAPCGKVIDLDLRELDPYGVRTARVVLQKLDLDDKSGSGAVALDLKRKSYFAGLLDAIPLRSKFESSRKFGPYDGKSLSIPFGPSIDYVLTDTIALAASGDGLLARVVGNGPAKTGPVLAIDISPPGLSAQTWESILKMIRLPEAKRIAGRLLRWREGHIAIRIDGTRLVLRAAGDRR